MLHNCCIGDNRNYTIIVGAISETFYLKKKTRVMYNIMCVGVYSYNYKPKIVKRRRKILNRADMEEEVGSTWSDLALFLP